MRRIKIFSVLILLWLTLTSQNIPVYAESGGTKIASDYLNVRSGPGLSYEVIDQLKRNDRVEVISTSGEWLQIQYKERKGWIASWLTTTDNSSNQGQATEIISQTDALNFRETPSLDAPVLNRMNAGDKAILLSRNGDWLHVQFNGENGWVYAKYTSEIPSQTQATTPPKTTEKKSFETFTVAVDTLNVRNKADQTSKKIGTVHKDESYSILKVEGNWVQIQLDAKKEGWVYAFHGELSQAKTTQQTKTNATAAQKVTILTNGTNIRSEATTSSEVVTRADAGEQFTVKENHGDWFEISLNSGETAFIAKWVVSMDDVPTKKKKKKKQDKRLPGTLNGLTIVVDAGHGGNDRGTTGARGTLEKTITLKTADLLAAKLQAAGATVHLTRESDTYISLQKRVAMSLEKEADAFISLHYDANLDASIRGFTTYYQHSNQKDFANTINNALGTSITLKDRGAQQADFYVLRENDENAILIELGFLSNPSEESIINSNSFREQATRGIYNGILNYFDATE